MSSQKKIGRWKRFEIAFAQENRPQKSLFQTPERSALDKLRDLQKIDKKATPNERAAVESGTTEKETRFENASPRQAPFPVSGTPSLWEEARRKRQDAAKKAAKKCKKRR